MTRPRVYVETTIPSAYHESRTAANIVARRDWTRRWWAIAPAEYELVTSDAVLSELANGPADRSPDWLALLAGLPAPGQRPQVRPPAAGERRTRVVGAGAGDAARTARGGRR